MVNKADAVMEHVKDCNADFALISETWLTSKHNDVTATVRSHGYLAHHHVRDDPIKKRGGGAAILYRAKYDLKRFSTRSYGSFEHFACSLSAPHTDKVVMVSFYRLQHMPFTQFFIDFGEFLEALITMNCLLIIAGDINIHIDDVSGKHMKELSKLLDCFNLFQLVNGSTQKRGHQLEVIITNDPEKFSNVVIDDVCLSDHYRISCSFVHNLKVLSEYRTIHFREIKSMNSTGFSDHIRHQFEDFLINNQNSSFSNCIASYNSILKSSLDKFAPIKQKIIKDVQSATWFDEDYRDLRKLRRNAEKLWRRTKLTVHRLEFVRLRKCTTRLANNKKRAKIRSKIDNACGNQKALYSALHDVTGQNQKPEYPDGTDINNANEFAKFFIDKVGKIRTNIESKQYNNAFSFIPDTFDNNNYLNQFEMCTESEILEIINDHGFKYSFIDPIPDIVAKDNFELLLPVWTFLVNHSLSLGSIDGILKQADIIPLLKDLGLDHNIRNHFRPVSNLQFIGKLIERVVAKRLKNHMKVNNLDNINQYGYKKGHSTETILLKITNDILIASDKKTATVLLLLDLSAAFDTIDIDRLLKILFHEIGIRSTALKWFSSFLKNRTMRVKINNSFSEVFEIKCGVPQGSVLGPLLFNIYIRSVYKHIEMSGFTIKGFADDHQLYVSFSPKFQYHFLGDKIRLVLNKIDEWMNCFFLKLNQSKTQVIVFGPASIRKKILINGVFVENDSSCIRFKTVVKNLGIFLDSEMSFADQVKSVVSKAFFSIKTISRIKSFLTSKEKCTLLTALVLSKLDYCNSLYYGINSSLLDKLQVVQNSAARLIFNKRRFDHSTGLLFQLHWLPVRDRIKYKVNLLTHKALYHPAPFDIQNLITLHSTRTFNLKGIYRSKSNYGDRAFMVYVVHVWNELPWYLKTETLLESFKKSLKTFLFKRAFTNLGFDV